MKQIIFYGALSLVIVVLIVIGSVVYVLMSVQSSPSSSSPTTTTSSSTSQSSSTTGTMKDTYPQHYFAPYIDVAHIPQYFHLTTTSENMTNLKYYTLGFVDDSGGCTASWDGTTNITQVPLMEDIRSLRNTVHGDVILSFGGFTGSELALTCQDNSSLEAQYFKVINEYAVTHIDFTLNENEVLDMQSVHRRNLVIAQLQQMYAQQGKSLIVTYTLPAMPSGLLQTGFDLLQDALKSGVQVRGVNVMAMDYSVAAGSTGMGPNTVDALQQVYLQLNVLKQKFPAAIPSDIWDMIGVEPMIGQNHDTTETFSLNDANQVVSFAQDSTHNLREITMWSLQRDFGKSTSSNTNLQSGITQSAYDFTKIFSQFTTTVVNSPSGSATPAASSTSTTNTNSTNLVLNPTFNTLSNWQCGSLAVATNNTLVITPSATDPGTCSQTVTGLQANTTYTLQLQMKGSYPHVQVGTMAYWFNYSDVVAYQTVTMPIQTGANQTSVVIKLYAKTGAGAADFQDVSLSN